MSRRNILGGCLAIILTTAAAMADTPVTEAGLTILGVPGDAVTSIATGDFNGDGRIDLAIGAAGTYLGDPSIQTGGERVYLFYGPLEANETPIDLVTEPADLTILGPLPHGGFARPLILADLSGDGCDDLIVGDGNICLQHSTGAVLIQFGCADLPAGTVLNWRDGGQPDLTIVDRGRDHGIGHSFVTGDFDGDGVLDLVIGGADGLASDRMLHLLRGPLTPADGPLRDLRDEPAALTVRIPYNPYYNTAWSGLAIGDLSGDGLADIAAGAEATDNIEAGHALVAVFFGRKLPADPVVWNIEYQPPDIEIRTGDFGGFRYFGEQIEIADYNDDARLDLLVTDPVFRSLSRGALFGVDGRRLVASETINLTDDPPDLTVLGRDEPNSLGWHFNPVAVADSTATDGSSLWFGDRDAVRNDQKTGALWRLDATQLAAGPLIELDAIAPAGFYYGEPDTGFGAGLAIADLDENGSRDVAVSAALLSLPDEGETIRGAVYVFYDQLTTPDDDDDTIADDDDNDTTPADDDDNDDNDDEGCAC